MKRRPWISSTRTTAPLESSPLAILMTANTYAERDDDLMRYLFKERVLKTASSTLNEASLQLFCDLLFLWLADGDRDKTEVWVTR